MQDRCAIVRMSVAPFLHQRLQFGIVPVRQHDAGGDEQVAALPAGFGNPCPSAEKSGRSTYSSDRQFDRLPNVGTRTLPPSTAS